jgi:hypothetical protein
MMRNYSLPDWRHFTVKDEEPMPPWQVPAPAALRPGGPPGKNASGQGTINATICFTGVRFFAKPPCRDAFSLRRVGAYGGRNEFMAQALRFRSGWKVTFE